MVLKEIKHLNFIYVSLWSICSFLVWTILAISTLDNLFLRQSSSCTNTVAVELQMSWQNLFFFKNVALFEWRDMVVISIISGQHGYKIAHLLLWLNYLHLSSEYLVSCNILSSALLPCGSSSLCMVICMSFSTRWAFIMFLNCIKQWLTMGGCMQPFH